MNHGGLLPLFGMWAAMMVAIPARPNTIVNGIFANALNEALSVMVATIVLLPGTVSGVTVTELVHTLPPELTRAKVAEPPIELVSTVMPSQASGLAARLALAGYEPVPVDMSELRKAGGGPKCCTLELRS